MKKLGMLIIVMIISAVGCKVQTTTEKKEVRSLRGDLALNAQSETPQPREWYTGGAPLKRSFAQQPPVVPHGIEDYEISLTGNACMNCHGKPDTGAPGLSDTHFRNREGQKLDTVAANRHFCTQCHVPQVNAGPIVDNTFKAGG